MGKGMADEAAMTNEAARTAEAIARAVETVSRAVERYDLFLAPLNNPAY
jgi:hypothetical protein